MIKTIAFSLILFGVAACGSAPEPKSVCTEYGPEYEYKPARGLPYVTKDCLRLEVRCPTPMELAQDVPNGMVYCTLRKK